GTYAQSATYTTPCSPNTFIINAVAGDYGAVLTGSGTNYSFTATQTPMNAGTVTSPIIMRGCSSFGSGTPVWIPSARTNGVGALVTTGMPTFSFDTGHYLNAGSYWI